MQRCQFEFASAPFASDEPTVRRFIFPVIYRARALERTMSTSSPFPPPLPSFFLFLSPSVQFVHRSPDIIIQREPHSLLPNVDKECHCLAQKYQLSLTRLKSMLCHESLTYIFLSYFQTSTTIWILFEKYHWSVQTVSFPVEGDESCGENQSLQKWLRRTLCKLGSRKRGMEQRTNFAPQFL